MENRQKILECALELFFRRGYDAVGIQEICQSAGVTKPTLYHYFGSKYGLLEKLLEEMLAERSRELTEKVLGMGSCRTYGGMEEMLYSFTTELINFVNGNQKAYMLFMSMSYSAKDSDTHRAIGPYLKAMYDMTVQFFAQSGYLLGNMNGRQEQFAIGFLGLINHYILFMEYQNNADGPILVSEEKKYSLIHQFMHGIFS